MITQSKDPNEMKSRLKRAVQSEALPAHLEMRVRASIRAAAQERPGRSWFAPAWGLAAAAAVLLVGVSGLRRGENATIASFTQQANSFLSVGLTDHLHCTILRKQRAEPESLETMKTKLGPQYAALIPAVEAQVPSNYRVLDAHLCHAQGREFVHLVLNQADRYLSVVVANRQAGEKFSTENLVPSLAQAGITFYQQGTGNFQIAGFESGSHLVYVISDLPREQNRQVMMAMAGDLKRALPAL